MAWCYHSLFQKDEEFKEEIATSPVAEEEFNEEPSEPPPPGGESLEEVRVPTPTVDEKPPATPTASAEGTQADVVKQSPTAPSKSTPPTVNNLSILAQKAPLIALQQALLQGNPLLLGMIYNLVPEEIVSLRRCKYRYRLTEYTTDCPNSTRADGDAAYSSFFTVSPFVAYTHSNTDCSGFADNTAAEFCSDSTTHDCPTSHSHTTSGIPSIHAAA